MKEQEGVLEITAWKQTDISIGIQIPQQNMKEESSHSNTEHFLSLAFFAELIIILQLCLPLQASLPFLPFPSPVLTASS
jgi:hypothetical protein